MSDVPPGFSPSDSPAHDRADTQHADAYFRATEHSPERDRDYARPWILIEPEGNTIHLPGATGVFFGLECRDGVSIDEASALAKELRRLCTGIAITQFRT